MSNIFYDHLIVFEEIDFVIKNLTRESEEKEELWKLIDEMTHHSVMICILEKLPRKYHFDFIEKFHNTPYDIGLIKYLNEKAGTNIEKVLKDRIINLEKEILKELRGT